jgi:flagellin-specific chaperone FliS
MVVSKKMMTPSEQKNIHAAVLELQHAEKIINAMHAVLTPEQKRQVGIALVELGASLKGVPRAADRRAALSRYGK